MNEITDIVSNGKDRYGIYLDNCFYCFLKGETIVKNNIKKGAFISKEALDEVQFENEKLIAMDRALKFLSSIKSEKQVKDYLYSKGYTSQIVNYVIDKLHKYNYLDDKLFAKAYYDAYHMKKGLRLIKFELETKGISNEIIKELFDEKEDDDESLIYLCEKYLSGKSRDKKTMQKLCNHLFSKGFTFDKINHIIKKYFYNFEENDESWN